MERRAPEFRPLPARAVGVLVSGAAGVLKTEGRAGPPGVVVFSRDGSYRWFYLPALPGEDGERVTLSVGAGNDATRSFEPVVLATKAAIERRGIMRQYAVIEAEVNGTLGSPPADSFVATSFRILDGTSELPFTVQSRVDEAMKDCKDRVLKSSDIDQALLEVQKAIGSSTDPTRDEKVEPYVTWSSETRMVQIECRVSITESERKSGIGIVPDQALGQPSDLDLGYKREFGVRAELTYTVTRDGALQPGSKVKVQPFLHEPAPPGLPVQR